MFGDLFDMLFGCWHKNYSFPITSKRGNTAPRSHAASITGTYVVCLDCGKEFAYDWNQMKVVTDMSETTNGPSPLTTRTVSGLSKAA